MRANDGNVDPAGRFWIGTMCEDETPDRAALYRYDPDGTLTTVLEPVSLSNGLGWTAGEQRMYYVDSPTKRIDVLDYDAETGDVADRRPFALIEDGHRRARRPRARRRGRRLGRALRRRPGPPLRARRHARRRPRRSRPTT